MSASKLTFLASFVGAAVFAAMNVPPAFAASPDPQVTITVPLADLNLNSEAGVQQALVRIRHAAQEICGDDGAAKTLTEMMHLRTCVDSTVREAVASSHLPALTAASQGGQATALASTAH